MIHVCTKCGYVVTDGYIYAINHNIMLCHDCLETEISNGNISLNKKEEE